jgi:hypothetical protein
MQLLWREMQQRQSERLEIVENDDVVEPGGTAQLLDAEGASRISDFDLISGDRPRHGDGAEPGWLLHLPKIGAKRVGKRGVLSAKKLPDVRKFEGGEVSQGETGVGTADIGDQGAVGQRICVGHARAG